MALALAAAGWFVGTGKPPFLFQEVLEMKEKQKTDCLVESVMDFTVSTIDTAFPLMSWSEKVVDYAVTLYRNIGRKGSYMTFAKALQKSFMQINKRFADGYAEDCLFGRIAAECKWIDTDVR
jgi:hypothetical protein